MRVVPLYDKMYAFVLVFVERLCRNLTTVDLFVIGRELQNNHINVNIAELGRVKLVYLRHPTPGRRRRRIMFYWRQMRRPAGRPKSSHRSSIYFGRVPENSI